MPYNLYWQGLWDVEYRDKSISLPGSCTGVFILPHILSFGANRFRCSTITCGSFRRAKVLVHFCWVWHLKHVGMSFPMSTSFIVKRSKQSCSCTCSVLEGIGRLKSQNGSNETDSWPHTVHNSVDWSWPANMSPNIELS